jgi:hypothetical protein
MAEQEDVTPEFLDSLERRLEDLRNQFEQHFLGVRKTAPLQDRTTVQYAIRKVSNYNIPNTRLRFRFQQLVSKFNAYNQYWNRTLTQIEEGRYSRDRFKMKLHTGAIDETAPAAAGKKMADKAGDKGKAPAGAISAARSASSLVTSFCSWRISPSFCLLRAIDPSDPRPRYAGDRPNDIESLRPAARSASAVSVRLPSTRRSAVTVMR